VGHLREPSCFCGMRTSERKEMHNKNRQYAPAGPDAKTAARFRRCCGKR
jgi:hypothetical protein